jgi:hypothetical protein
MRPMGDQAELMKRRTAGARNNLGRPNRVGKKFRDLYRVVWIVVIFATFCARPVFGQASPSPTPTSQPIPAVVRIDVSKADVHSSQYVFPKNEAQEKTKLEFTGNKKDWSFVRFEPFQTNVSLNVDGQPDGYLASQSITAGMRYWFKNRLPLVLTLDKETHSPISLTFSFGSLRGPDGNNFETFSPQQKQEWFENHEGSFTRNPDANITFTWGPLGTTPVSNPSISPTTTQTPQDKNTGPQESMWRDLWNFLTGDGWIVGLIILGVIALGVILIVTYVVPSLISRIREKPGKREHVVIRRTYPNAPPRAKPAVDTDPYANLGNTSPADAWTEMGGSERELQPADSKRGIGKRDNDRPLAGKDQRGKKEPAGRPAAQVSYPSSKSAASTTPTFRDLKVSELEVKIKALENQLGEKLGRGDGLTEAARNNVTSIVQQAEQDILARAQKSSSDKLNDELGTVQGLMQAQELSVRARLDETQASVRNLSAENERVKEHFTEALNALGKAEARINNRLKEFQAALDRQTVPDSFYAKTLAAVIGVNADALQPGEFERLISDRLNQFFQTGVDRGDGLADVRARADRINAIVKELATQIEKLSAKAHEEARPHLQEVEKLVADLSAMQSELRDRRTVLHIPVSLHSGARQTFLDGLGRGIKREIEKLDDPEKYFQGELERLITSNLIPVVDICDGIASHGLRPELEETLKRLFAEANLSPIVPVRGEPFRAANHDLIETVSGGASLTVSEVVLRGFYYNHNDDLTLLRKAGVKVYR